MRLLSIGILFALTSVFSVNAASISLFNNDNAGYALEPNSEIVFDTVNVDTTGDIEDSFIHLYYITVSQDLNTLTSALTFATSEITDAVLSILTFDMTSVLASTTVTAGVESSLAWLMTSPPGDYWIQFSGILVDSIDSYQLKISAVPIPAAIWLFGSALIGMIGFGRRRSIKVPALTA